MISLKSKIWIKYSPYFVFLEDAFIFLFRRELAKKMQNEEIFIFAVFSVYFLDQLFQMINLIGHSILIPAWLEPFSGKKQAQGGRILI